MTASQVISLLSGVALFLFGMTLMGDGLKQVAGAKLELILYKLSNTPIRGLLLGTGVTGVVQSSGATSIMAIGFVNAGMMTVRQSIPVIIGSILGTSVTGWVICLSYIGGGGTLGSLLSTATLTGLIAIVGILLRMFTKDKTKRRVGDILMGFAVLMTGMSVMSSAVSPLGEQAWFTGLFTSLSNPLLGITVGAVFTAILQSASASVGIIQALAFTGAMRAGEALPLLMGVAIGACAPVLLGGLGAGTNGKRTAFVYPVAGVIGVGATAIVFYILNAILDFSFLQAQVSPFTVAGINTLLRAAMTLTLMPMIRVLEAIVTRFIREKPEESARALPGLPLESRFLRYPSVAVEQSRIAVNEMSKRSEESIKLSILLLTAFDKKMFDRVITAEEDVDVYEDKLGAYLTQITASDLSREQSADVAVQLHALTDLERISDHARNIAESAKEIRDKSISFSEQGLSDLAVLNSAVQEILRLAMQSLRGDDADTALRVEPLEEWIDTLCDRLKRRHVERLQREECTIAQGFVFNDLLSNFERVSDHCSNIAAAVIEHHGTSMESHELLHDLKERDPAAFKKAYEEYAIRFEI